MREKTVWTFDYKGIFCEIVHWGIDEMVSVSKNGIFNGYIYIFKKQLPRSFKNLLVEQRSHKYPSGVKKHWDYGKLENIFDMHGGITYYELLGDEFSGEPTGVKVGCDYAHIWDDERYIDEKQVEHDLKNSVDTFIKHFPNYLIRDFKDGKYKKPSI
jgi:hypothetical protein